MNLVMVAGYVLVLVVIVTTTGLLTSRSAIQRLIDVGFLPRTFGQFVPALTHIVRTLAVALILVGLSRLAIVAGLVSWEWLQRYGFAVVLIVLGSLIFLFTLHGKREG